MLYRVVVNGHLDEHWAHWFDDMTVTHQGDGTTIITAPMPDQTALYRLLGHLRDLGVTLLVVKGAAAGRHITREPKAD
jgi:hypothetical protein